MEETGVASVLGNDNLLREILLRLDFPTCFVRAAVVSKRWLLLVSDPAFLWRFRDLHLLRLLGFYFCPQSYGQVPRRPELLRHLRFVPMPQSPDSAAVIRRISFEVGHDVRGVLDCRNGRLAVFNNYSMGNYALFSPLHPTRGTTTRHPEVQIPEAARSGGWGFYRFALLPEDGGDDMSCTAGTLMLNSHGRVCTHVSDLQDRAWREGTTSGFEFLPQTWTKPLRPLLAYGKLYMICMAAYILGLDLPSMSLFYIKLPDGVGYDCDTNLGLCRAEGSGFFLIHVKGFQICVWIHSTGCSTGNWELVDSICLHRVFGYLVGLSQGADVPVQVAAVGDNADFVFLQIEHTLLYMHIRSRALEKVYESQKYELDFEVHPFMIVWPPTFPTLNNGRDLVG